MDDGHDIDVNVMDGRVTKVVDGTIHADLSSEDGIEAKDYAIPSAALSSGQRSRLRPGETFKARVDEAGFALLDD